MIPVVAGKEDDRIVELAERLQGIEEATEGLVEAFDHTTIAGPMLRGRAA